MSLASESPPGRFSSSQPGAGKLLLHRVLPRLPHAAGERRSRASPAATGAWPAANRPSGAQETVPFTDTPRARPVCRCLLCPSHTEPASGGTGVPGAQDKAAQITARPRACLGRTHRRQVCHPQPGLRITPGAFRRMGTRPHTAQVTHACASGAGQPAATQGLHRDRSPRYERR